MKKPWSKWRFLGVYWAIQGVGTYTLWPLLFARADGLGDWLGLLANADYAMCMVPPLLCIMAAQAVILAPIGRPSAAGATPAGFWLRHAMAGIATGGIAGYLAILAWFTIGLVYDGQPDWLPLEPWLLFVLSSVSVAMLTTPLFAWRYRAGTPAWLTLVIAACCAASLAMAIVMALGALVVTGLGSKRSLLQGDGDAAMRQWWIAALAVLIVGWLVATPLLLAFRRQDREVAIARVASLLFLGTVIEAGAIIPMDVMVRRKTNCYCGEGTLWALTICWGVGTLVLGPAIWLIPFGKRRKRRLSGRFEVCNYDLAGSMNANRCPECGSGWRTDTAQ